MYRRLKLSSILLLFVVAFSAHAAAQSTPVSVQSAPAASDPAAYKKMISQRADKIVAQLNISGTAKTEKVRDIIAQQYSDLNDIHSGRDNAVKAIKAENSGNKALADSLVKTRENETLKKQDALHAAFLAKLSRELTPEQVDKVKDGLTYGVLPITYKGYQDMLPNLTPPQKTQILAWLTEAREHAMDAESSDKKHAWFGKYKGRINNYLSAAGYNMKQAGEDWQKRIKAAEAEKARN